MKKIDTRIWQATMKMCIGIGLLIFTLVSSASADTHLEILEKEQRIILTGKISEALGEYASHLKGAVEYLICGHNGKAYESIIVVDATAKEIHNALSELGVKVGTPPSYDEEKDEPIPPKGTEVFIFVEWQAGDKTEKVRAEELVLNLKTQKPMQQVAWIYSGSRVVPDLDSEDEEAMVPQAFMSNDIVALRLFDASALFQNPLPESLEENIYKKNDALLPELGTPVIVTIEVNRKMQLYVLITGKVQGVGFRNFTQRNARELGVNGYAKNLPNGKVEVVAEGDKMQIETLLAFLKKGPRYARVDAIEIEERPFTGDYETFGIRY